MAVDVAAVAEKLITAEEFAEMSDLAHCELVAGKIVPMTPPGDAHGGVEANITAIIVNFVRTGKLGKVRSGESGVLVGRDPDIVRGADILFISHGRYAQKTHPTFLDVAPNWSSRSFLWVIEHRQC